MTAELATQALGGKWRGRYGIAMCPVHDNHRTPALSLADGEDGKLLVHCFAGCDGADILRELNQLGLGDADIVTCAPQKLRPRPSDNRDFALKLWQEAFPVHDTLAERYLRERGIRPPFPASLRFHPSLLHSPSQTRHPAMLGLVTTGVGNEATGIEDVIPLTFTTPNLGGRRTWFVCPSCGKRKGVLWGRTYYRCAECYRMTYDSQYEDRPYRLLDRAQAILMKLGGSGSCDEPFPPKPKGMHWQTYSRHMAEYERLYSEATGAMAQELGCLYV